MERLRVLIQVAVGWGGGFSWGQPVPSLCGPLCSPCKATQPGFELFVEGQMIGDFLHLGG